MPHETGTVFNVDNNKYPIPDSVPTLMQLFTESGYDAGYFGKEHTGGVASRTVQNFGSLKFPRAGHWADGSVLDPIFTRDAIEFIRTPRKKPYFATVSLVNPHDICYQWPTAGVPIRSMADLLRAFDRRDGKYLRGQDMPPAPPNVDPEVPAGMRPRRNPIPDHPMNEWERRLFVATYYLLIETTDWLIGRILDAARQAARDENTLVLFTSDHGEQMGAHGLYGKGVFYEEAARVPFTVSWKGAIKPGQMNRDALVSGIDVLPTLCDYAGIRIPAGVTGRSLRPLIQDRNAPWRESLVTELFDGRMLRTRTHKYIQSKRAELHEFLFDLRNDPGETRDLAQDAGSRSVLDRHREVLANWMKETGGTLELTMSQVDRRRQF
jgi:arylsulfatase A-like enzyme